MTKKMANTSKVVFITALIGLTLAGCNRPASDQAAGKPTAGTTSSSSGASTASGSSAGSAIDDSIITTKVKTALLADADIKGTDINVETQQGEVMLSGFVNNKAQTDKAVKVARAVEGVKKVTDKTAVKQ
jgi:hyperosmotically inducible protein